MSISRIVPRLKFPKMGIWGALFGVAMLLVLFAFMIHQYKEITLHYENMLEERCTPAIIGATNYHEGQNKSLEPDDLSLKSNSSMVCNRNSWRTFFMDDNSILRRYQGNDDFWEQAICCYTPYKRTKDSHREILISSTCHEIKVDTIKLPYKNEFIRLKCHFKDKKDRLGDIFYLDFFAAVPLKEKTELRIQEYEKEHSLRNINDERLNIVFLGYNLQYFEPVLDEYIMKSLFGIRFEKFRLVGDFHHENMLAFHMGMTKREFRNSCFSLENDFLDNKCSLIWNRFAENGYRTSFADNSLENNFWNDPTYDMLHKTQTDYDLRALTTFLGDIKVGKSEKHYCEGYCPKTQAILDNIVRTATTLKSRKYFQFSWISSLKPGDARQSKYIATSIIEVLTKLERIHNLNQTVFILLADQVMKFDAYQYETADTEKQLPYFYTLFPPWFKLKYPKAMSNLKENANRLTSFFDLHLTINDLADLKTITNEGIVNREHNVEEMSQRGISLFLPIDKNRHCDNAGIPENHCVCHQLPFGL